MEYLHEKITNKEIYPQLESIVKSWIVMKSKQESEPTLRPLLLIYDTNSDTNDREIILSVVSGVLIELGFINNTKIISYNEKKKDIIEEGLEKATGGVLCLYRLIQYQRSDIGYIQRLLKQAQENNIFLIVSQDRQCMKVVKDTIPNLNSFLLRFDMIEFGTIKYSEFTVCFELVMKSDGFVAEDGLLLFVENLFHDKKLKPLENEGSLETVKNFWSLVKSAWSSRVYAPQDELNNIIRIDDVKSVSARFVSWGYSRMDTKNK